MARIKINYTDHFDQVMKAMTTRGLLVGSYDAAGRANAMTIGWGSIGSIWGMPVWIVLVRPSRHTYSCIEHSGCFTVNVPPEGLRQACALCGSRSGRDIDKFKECGLTAERATSVLAPAVAQCPIVYECQVVHSNDVAPSKLAHQILTGAYANGDFHRIYYGKILATLASEDAGDLLKQ